MPEPNAAPAQSPAVIVVGAGPAGLTAAITIAAAGVPTVLAGQSPGDNRTTALLAGSVIALETLDVWQRCASYAAPLRTMRIVDDTGRLLRAPEVKFDAAEIGLDAFGQNIENLHLLTALAERARSLKDLTWIGDRVVSVETGPQGATVAFAAGQTITTALVIGADGRTSLCRSAAGIPVETRRYPQSALTVCLSHGRPHHDASTEFHTGSGPFTLVPLPGQRSSLVWVMDPDRAEAISAQNDDELAADIERQSHAILGKITLAPGRGLFPLSMTRAQRFAANRIALIGEAAHVMPPIGAQGLNLGLRDAASIGELVVDAWRNRHDLGADRLLADYDRQRRADVGSRALAIDFLNRSLLSDFLPVQGARRLGLYLIDRIGPLRRALMREGIAPAASQPRLMRGQAI
jgi:2-octaprenyl-6-methoxyphenol hydroxylase